MKTSLRELLRFWEEKGTLYRVRKEVDPEFELGRVVKSFKGRQPLLFEKVRGYDVPMVAGLGGDRKLLAESLGLRQEELVPRLIQAIRQPLPTRRVSSAPVQENVLTGRINLEEMFPICRYHEGDSARYLVSGVLVAKDSKTGNRLTSIRRMQYLGGNRVNVLISSPDLMEQYLHLERRGEPMEVAVMFGVVPGVILSSQISTHLYQCDKLNVAGALLGKPLDVVPCKTVELEVLAEAEVVLEGRMLPYVRVMEGPFGELAGYYGNSSPQPVIEFTALTFRNNPIWQTIFPSSYEERLPMAIAREAVLYSTVRQVVPGLQRVHVTLGGVGRYHAILSIEKRAEGDGKQALLASFAADKDLKHVVVVDDDVDIFDWEDVEWAIATRVQADKDVFIVPGANGSSLEPSHQLREVTAKMGIDATKPLRHADLFRRTRVPGEETFDVRDYLA